MSRRRNSNYPTPEDFKRLIALLKAYLTIFDEVFDRGETPFPVVGIPENACWTTDPSFIDYWKSKEPNNNIFQISSLYIINSVAQSFAVMQCEPEVIKWNDGSIKSICSFNQRTRDQVKATWNQWSDELFEAYCLTLDGFINTVLQEDRGFATVNLQDLSKLEVLRECFNKFDELFNKEYRKKKNPKILDEDTKKEIFEDIKNYPNRKVWERAKFFEVSKQTMSDAINEYNHKNKK